MLQIHRVWNEWEEFVDRDGIRYQKVDFGLYQGSAPMINAEWLLLMGMI